MGRQSRIKRQRRAAEFSVRSPGALEVLSIGKGDHKIVIGSSEKDRADAERLIEEMLRKGYTLFVETEDGPLRVVRFLADQMAYEVAATVPVASSPELTARPPEPDAEEEPVAEPRPPGGRRKRTVPVEGSKTTAIGRTAGG